MVGAHISTIGGLPGTFERADSLGYECIQIYTSPSRQWSVPPIPDAEITAFRKARVASRVRSVVAHVPFLVNIASPDQDLRRRSMDRLTLEFQRGDLLGIDGIVLHPGSPASSGRSDAIKRIVDGLNGILAGAPGSGCRILLENMAGQGAAIGSYFEDLTDIIAGLPDTQRIGVCFDTAHAFISGYPLRGYEGYAEVLSHFDKTIGIGWIKAIHANDALTGMASHNDKHAAIGEGMMGRQVFHALLTDARFREIPKIVELADASDACKASIDLMRALASQQTQIGREYEPVLTDQLALFSGGDNKRPA